MKKASSSRSIEIFILLKSLIWLKMNIFVSPRNREDENIIKILGYPHSYLINILISFNLRICIRIHTNISPTQKDDVYIIG